MNCWEVEHFLRLQRKSEILLVMRHRKNQFIIFNNFIEILSLLRAVLMLVILLHPNVSSDLQALAFLSAAGNIFHHSAILHFSEFIVAVTEWQMGGRVGGM